MSFPPETNLPTSNTDTTPNNEEKPYEPLTYDELFPELPTTRPRAEDVSGKSPPYTWTKNDDMRIASSVITHMFRLPVEERAKIDGSSQFGESASSRICADITAKTKAHIEISIAKDQSLTFLITGKNDEVLDAKKLALEKFQTLATQTIQIPKEHHGYILGKNGTRLKELESSTDTKIHFPNINDASNDIVIVGMKDSIEKAVHEIQLISDKRSKEAYEKLDIPRMYHPFLTPSINNKLNQLVTENGVRVNFPPFNTPKTEITIFGKKEAVLQCKELMNEIYKTMLKKCQTVSVEVPKSQHKRVIGPKGSNIAEILRLTNVSVEMSPEKSPSETVTLRGPQEKLGQALTMVYEKANTETVEAPAWLHKFIIGKKGANIKQITQDILQVHVEFTDKGGIRLDGPQEEVEILQKRLEDTVADMKAKLTFDEIALEPKLYKLVSKNDNKLNRIRSDNGVLINISEVNGQHVIRLEGSHEGVRIAKQEVKETLDKMENEREREIMIESRFHRNIIGTKGDKIKEIRERFNQIQISIPDQGSEKSDIVKLRGPKEDVDQCYQFLEKMVKELRESNYQLKVSIFRQFHKFIIGKGGANIKQIREETNTRIELPSEGQNSDDITIIGRKENCEKARDKIKKIQNELANIVELDIMIPGKFHNAMIGAGGKFIQSISEECGGVSIKFPPPESKSDRVTIRGPKEDVHKAKQMMVELSNEKQLSSCTAEVRAKPELHRFLIGRNGVNIRKLRDETGARIIFPNDKDVNKDLITIIGKKEAVEKARTKLKAIVEELDKVVEETISIDPKFHRHFVGRRGEVLKQISEQYENIAISFPRQNDPSDKVTIKGIKEAVDGAKARIQEIVSDLEQVVTIEVNIPQRYHRTVMGSKGVKVQGITTEFDVQIKFPEKDFHGDNDNLPNGDLNPRPQDVVIIQGKKENCEAAKNALQALVPIKVEVPVAFKYHRFIIGQKGETVRSFMSEFDVNIQVPGAEEQKDRIFITGTATSVEAAKAAIEAKVEELKEEEEDRLLRSFQLQLRIDPEYHPKIIGRKGTVISKIREKHNVNIQFPARGGSDSDMITISGYEKNCEKAKEEILSITGDLEKMVKKSVNIDSRIHSRLIGARGRAIRKIMEEHKVEIKFPRGTEDPNQVMVLGTEEDVDECIDYLLNLEEEYLQDISDQYTFTPSANNASDSASPSQNTTDKGFVVSGAPWTQATPNMESSEDFPSMGSATAPSVPPVCWPRRS